MYLHSAELNVVAVTENVNTFLLVWTHVSRYGVRAVFTWLSTGIGFGFGFTTPFGWLVYLLWFWFYDSQVKTALIDSIVIR